VPDKIEMQMVMLCTDSEKNHYYSLYRFKNPDKSKTEKFENTLHRNAKLNKIGNDMYTIE